LPYKDFKDMVMKWYAIKMFVGKRSIRHCWTSY
jgi:hypothetical protein